MKKLNCILSSLVYLLGTCSLTSCGKLTYEQSKNKLKENFKVEDYLYLKTFDNSDVFEKFKYTYDKSNLFDYTNTYTKITSVPELIEEFGEEEVSLTTDFMENFGSEGNEKNYFNENNYKYYNFWAFNKKRILIYPYKNEDGKYGFCFTDSKLTNYGQSTGNWASLIESNGIFGFVITFDNQEFLNYTLSMLYNTDNFDYDIYFLKHEVKYWGIFFDMYLIPKDENFSKYIIIKFAELGNYTYFDVEAIRNS